MTARSLARRSAGVSQPSVLRGRPLSSAATAARCSGVWTARSVPLGKYWRSSPPSPAPAGRSAAGRGDDGGMTTATEGRGMAELAALLADGTRAGICLALLDGRAWTAGELARRAGVAPSTASDHLTRLVRGGLLVEERQGRHRYLRLAGPSVAQLIEDLAGHAPTPPAPAGSLRAATASTALAYARTCYDHLAGRLGVLMYDALLARRAAGPQRRAGAHPSRAGLAGRAGRTGRGAAERPTAGGPRLPGLDRTPPAPRRRARRGPLPPLRRPGLDHPGHGPRRPAHPDRPPRSRRHPQPPRDRPRPHPVPTPRPAAAPDPVASAIVQFRPTFRGPCPFRPGSNCTIAGGWFGQGRRVAGSTVGR